MDKENNYILLPKKEYEKLFSDCLKGKVPTNIRLDTEALTNLLALENVADGHGHHDHQKHPEGDQKDLHVVTPYFLTR